MGLMQMGMSMIQQGGLKGYQSIPPCKDKCVMYSKQPNFVDKIGRDTRNAVLPKVVVGDGNLECTITGYISGETLTYIDDSTGEVINTSLDANDKLIIPTNGMRNLIIDGFIYNWSSLIDVSDTSAATVYDTTGTVKLQFNNTYADWFKSTVHGVDVCDEEGYRSC